MRGGTFRIGTAQIVDTFDRRSSHRPSRASRCRPRIPAAYMQDIHCDSRLRETRRDHSLCRSSARARLRATPAIGSRHSLRRSRKSAIGRRPSMRIHGPKYSRWSTDAAGPREQNQLQDSERKRDRRIQYKAHTRAPWRRVTLSGNDRHPARSRPTRTSGVDVFSIGAATAAAGRSSNASAPPS